MHAPRRRCSPVNVGRAFINRRRDKPKLVCPGDDRPRDLSLFPMTTAPRPRRLRLSDASARASGGEGWGRRVAA